MRDTGTWSPIFQQDLRPRSTWTSIGSLGLDLTRDKAAAQSVGSQPQEPSLRKRSESLWARQPRHLPPICRPRALRSICNDSRSTMNIRCTLPSGSSARPIQSCGIPSHDSSTIGDIAVSSLWTMACARQGPAWWMRSRLTLKPTPRPSISLCRPLKFQVGRRSKTSSSTSSGCKAWFRSTASIGIRSWLQWEAVPCLTL